MNLLHLARLSTTPRLIRPDHDLAHHGHLAQLATQAAERLTTQAAAPTLTADRMAPWDEREALQNDAHGTAIIPIHGTIGPTGYDAHTAWCYDLVRPEAIETALATALDDDTVQRIVLSIDSPGGYAQSIAELHATLTEARALKPIIAYTRGQACSAAYWIACAASVLVASRSAQVGSIGTYCTIYDWSAHFAQAGIKAHVLKTGALKAIGVMGTEVTPEQLAYLQSTVDKIQSQFLAAVKASRGDLAPEDLQGQWFDGETALAKGLIDAHARTLEDLLAQLAADA